MYAKDGTRFFGCRTCDYDICLACFHRGCAAGCDFDVCQNCYDEHKEEVRKGDTNASLFFPEIVDVGCSLNFLAACTHESVIMRR